MLQKIKVHYLLSFNIPGNMRAHDIENRYALKPNLAISSISSCIILQLEWRKMNNFIYRSKLIIITITLKR
jgi:hypothetical protein